MKPIRILLAVFVCSIVATSLGKPQPGGKSHENHGRDKGFDWVNLVSDINGVARHTDENLINPWGLVISPTGAVWVANAGSGVSTVYNLEGEPLPNETTPLVVTIPTAPTNTEGGNPTGIVFNPTSDFVVSQGGRSGKAIFIFVAEDGTISGWNPTVDPTHAVLAVDASATGAIYKGLALGVTGGNSFLYATNFHAGTVEIFDKNFAPVIKPGAFHDANIPAGYAPFGIQNIENHLFVTYALQDADAEDDVPGAGNGFVNVFDLEGNLVRRFATQGALNAPWGLARAPHKFGKVGNALLIGNFGDGRINAFDFTTGALLGPLEDADGVTLAFDGLWGLAFSGKSLFFTAGIADEEHGLFGVITRAKHDDNGKHLGHGKGHDKDGKEDDDQGEDDDDQGEDHDED
ncbi:MAG TPA: TIGR03118 family protein [Chthoniobacteraceae bacterium]|nr:TIGR03118 family protein [Chthoniobacteraceae bacterium]